MADERVRITFELDAAKRAELERFARERQEDLPAALNEAVDRFLSYCRSIEDEINRGMEDVAAGRLIDHEEIEAKWEARFARSLDKAG